MGDLRPHGVLPDYEQQISGAVEGVCVAADALTMTVIFTIPSYSPDLRYGPAPYTGHPDTLGGVVLPPIGSRVLVIFPSNGRPWVVGWTDQP